MKNKWLQVYLVRGLFLLAFILQGCSDPGSAGLNKGSGEASTKPIVFVPISPYQYVFERLAGDLIDLRVIVGPGDDPHSYLPTPKQIVDMARADLLCSAELGFESNYFVKMGDGNTGPQELNLLAGLELLEGHCDHPSHETETTEDDEDHDHEELNDPHVWLSPTMLMLQVNLIASKLKGMLPKEKALEIDSNLSGFKAELTAIHDELTALLATHQGQKFYVYHSAFAYFARDFGLEQVAIEIGNRSPTPKQLAQVAAQAKSEEVKVIFVQPQFDQTSAAALAESISGRVAFLDPLEKDITANLRAIAKAITGNSG
ncbi:MAG: zinc ABC transporter solute-binding protein [Verrucomicrobiaceae bacterium]|nr:zinc ABC transporter solute-binding protein [Verrucomicrobiaceae bacterium]